MIHRLLATVLFACICALVPAYAGSLQETPSLGADVKAGKLPPVAERLPETPRVINMGALDRKPGKHGGTIRMLMGKQKDVRMMTVYGYARLVGFNKDFELVPDILESFDVKEGRIFTFKLRKGHKWSDGKPFTTADIRYVWEDVFNNEELSRTGPPRQLLVKGKPPKFEVIDEVTVRFTWEEPNPDFLPALAAPRPLFLALPAHYMKQFHAKYQDKAKLEEMVEKERARKWRGLHIKKGRQYRPENPDLPTLDPWHNTINPPSEQFVFERNPYFHRVDENGRQLPYIDKIIMSMGSTSLVPAKTGAGDSDLQARYIRFDNYTFLKEAEKRGKIKVRLWRYGFGSKLALLPNLNVEDPVWRKLVRDVRFRRAISLGIDREDLNQSVFYGLGRESADTVLPESPLFREEYANAWIAHDPEQANKLLDEIGLDKRNGEGTRLLPNGNPADLIIETAGESTEETDVLELIADHLSKIGIKVFVRASQREVLRRRVFSGQTVMSVWAGLDNALPTADMNPWEVSPSSDAQLQWPRWGQYYETGGAKGEPADIEEAKQLAKFAQDWRSARSTAERAEIWHKMLSLYTDQVFSIGTVNSTRQPVVSAAALENIPEEGVWSFSPGSYFGIYNMDAFWFSGQ